MRQGIIGTLAPFITVNDTFTAMLERTMLRLLQRASLEQLVDVLLSAKAFVNDMEPYLAEANNAGFVDTYSRTYGDGSGIDSGSIPIREIDPISTNHPEFLAEVQRKVSGFGSGYETPVEGEPDSNGSETVKAVS